MTNLKIMTERLELRPLTSEQLMLYTVSPAQLGEIFTLSEPLTALDEHMIKVYKLKAMRIEENPNELLFHTYYLIIEKTKRQMVGFLGLQGVPDSEGIVEVGYHIFKHARNQGYMKEALGAFCQWMMKMPEVSAINACTTKSNFASHSVLEFCGFDVIYQKKDMMVWTYSSI